MAASTEGLDEAGALRMAPLVTEDGMGFSSGLNLASPPADCEVNGSGKLFILPAAAALLAVLASGREIGSRVNVARDGSLDCKREKKPVTVPAMAASEVA